MLKSVLVVTNCLFIRLKIIKNPIILILIITFSCNPTITNVSQLIEAHEKATTTSNANWNDFSSKKTFYNFKIKIRGKLMNSANQVISNKGNDFQKTETFQNYVLSKMTTTKNDNSSMINLKMECFLK